MSGTVSDGRAGIRDARPRTTAEGSSRAALSRDIVVTWPKSRPFGSYIAELERARARGLVVCYRVRSLPPYPPGAFDYGAPELRCYRVHDGKVRGYTRLLLVEWRGVGEVERVLDDPGSGYWPPGNYLVCDPDWHDISPTLAMPGFRGWRWFDRPAPVAGYTSGSYD